MKTTAVNFYAVILCASLLISCTKITDTVSGNNIADECNKVKAVKVSPVAAVNPGATIVLTASDCDGLYNWYGPDNFQSSEQTNTISDVTYSNQGWYYLSVSNPDCATGKYDSVYVTVNFPQGTPSCSLTDNVMAFDALPEQDFTSGVYFNGSNGYSLEGNSNAGDVTVIFSSYWFSHEPLDGVYTTTSDQLFDASNIDQIFISDVNEDIYFVGEPGKPVYVSHVNGKLRVSFCSINFTGDDGQYVFHSLASAQLTEK